MDDQAAINARAAAGEVGGDQLGVEISAALLRSTVDGTRAISMGARLRRLRASMRLSQQAFADRFGLRASTVRDLEQGRSRAGTGLQLFVRVIELDPGLAARAAGEGQGGQTSRPRARVREGCVEITGDPQSAWGAADPYAPTPGERDGAE